MTSVHPLANRALYLQAEKAAEAVVGAHRADAITRELRTRMDEAACKVFVAAGAAGDVAQFFASCITSDVLERVQKRPRSQAK